MAADKGESPVAFDQGADLCTRKGNLQSSVRWATGEETESQRPIRLLQYLL